MAEEDLTVLSVPVWDGAGCSSSGVLCLCLASSKHMSQPGFAVQTVQACIFYFPLLVHSVSISPPNWFVCKE